MLILNPAVSNDIANSIPLRLDLGAGTTAKRDGYYSVDSQALPGTDILADVCKPWDQIGDGSVCAIYSRHTLEHVSDLCFVMEEAHRVLAPGGLFYIIVPHFSNTFAYSDPTHVRFFGIYSMFYFAATIHQPWRKVPCYYSKARFFVQSVNIAFYRYTLFDRLVASLLGTIVNRTIATQEFYERRLSRFLHAHEIHFALRPDDSRAADP